VAENLHNIKLLRFDGRVAVVTGVGRGLGREFARLLAQRGAAVVVNDAGRSEDDQYGARDAEDDDPAQCVIEEIESAGGSAIAITADASDPASGEGIMTTAVRTFGGSDILINNAGILPYAPLEELSSAQFLRTIAVDAGGAFHLSREAWRHFRVAGYGRVVNICSSVCVVYGNDNYAAYASAKGALLHLTRVTAWEGESHGILVNGLLPNAATRARACVAQPLPTSRNDHDRSAELAAHAAAWFAHEQCSATGNFFAVKSGSMGQVLMSVAEGFQAPKPDEFSLELIRDDGALIDRRPAISPTDATEYNQYRHTVYERLTGLH
jgi:NAD(P)-dependent dehydrogenase (short-subunit alcohol dehydrogenase family)